MEASLISMAAFALVVAGCAALTPRGTQKYYEAPAAPPDQLAVMTIDSRAEVLEIDQLPVSYGKQERYIAPGCREVTAKYEESYFIWGGEKAARQGVGAKSGWGVAQIANSEIHNYDTLTPISFFIFVKAGHKYWVTASFTGDEFLPRVVELDASGEASARFLPNEPCAGSPAAR